MNIENLKSKSEVELRQIAEALTALEYKQKYSAIDFKYPETGTLSRHNYPKHMEFFKAGANHLIRAFIGGNGTGKTMGIGCEAVYHLTGLYPEWWEGKRYNRPIKAWFCARETKQLRDAMQEILFGNLRQGDEIGTGLIPKVCLLDDRGQMQTTAYPNGGGAIGTASIRHFTNGVFDGWSEIQFKTYAQGWQEFQGSTRDLVWLDEEPDDSKVYAECLARTRGPKGEEGAMICTFTPLLGYSTMYLSFLPNGREPHNGEHPENKQKYVKIVTWNDVPHLSEEYKQSMIAEWKLSDPNSIEARINGVAAIGSGRIYPINEDFVVVEQKKMPSYWRKAYGLDPGWNNTAIIWIAEDPNTGIKYIYSEYKHGKVVYPIHVEAIKLRGEFIPGACDPHEAPKPRDDGTSTIDYLNGLGLNLVSANGNPNALRAMILSMFESGALKIMDNCEKLLQEIRLYRYDLDDPNKPAKDQDDHLCDAMMYCIAKFDEIAISSSEVEEEMYNFKQSKSSYEQGRNDLTGY